MISASLLKSDQNQPESGQSEIMQGGARECSASKTQFYRSPPSSGSLHRDVMDQGSDLNIY